MLDIPRVHGVEVGVDEVGRGCLFGPVVAGAVVLPPNLSDPRWGDIKDSKKLSEKKRQLLATFIKEHCIAYGYGVISNQEIDRINILKATFLAMNAALDDVYRKCKFDFIRVDGPHFPGYMPPGNNDEHSDCIAYDCTPNGDAQILSIACASIIAKTYRDESMIALVESHPELELNRYGICKNKGYGTKQHMDAIQAHGPTPWHRLTFRGVK